MLFTVLTTTYNRAYRLGDLYESLKRQTARNFEWVIIDDGSTDNTRELVEGWTTDSTRDFDIIYKYTENGGKHRGLNRGYELANGVAVINVDSDDFMLDDAIEFFTQHFHEVADDDSFAGISGMKCFRDGKIIGGDPTFGEYVDADSYTFDFKIHVGDKAEAYKTELLRKYPFPAFAGENFMSEGAVFFRIAHEGYKVRWYSKPLVCCEYLPDGLTQNSFNHMKNNPKGWAEYVKAKNLFGCDLDLKSKRKIWSIMHQHFEKSEFCELLDMSKETYETFEKEYSDFKKSLEEKLSGCCDVAVYGYGNNGKYLKVYLEDMGKKVSYLIDKSGSAVLGEIVLLPEDELPDVDAVVISLGSKYDTEIREISIELKGKLQDSRIIVANTLDLEKKFF